MTSDQFLAFVRGELKRGHFHAVTPGGLILGSVETGGDWYKAATVLHRKHGKDINMVYYYNLSDGVSFDEPCFWEEDYEDE